MPSNDRPRSFARWLVPAVLLALFASLVWRFAWLNDDAFISFRYARNFATGHGLVFNTHDAVRVEGYTNLLWVLGLSIFERLGVDVPLVSQLVSAACGLVLVHVLWRASLARAGGDLRVALAAALFPVTLAPLAVWATSGLETLPHALALTVLFTSLFAARPSVTLASACAAGALLLRADGAVHVALVLGAALGAAWSDSSRARARATLAVAAIAALVLAAHLLWRHGYYGEWAPNTARVKVELGALTLERGALYVLGFLLAFPASALAALVVATLVRRPRDAFGLAAASIALGITAYAVVVGGDYMAMGRFLVPALPFAALAFAAALARIGSRKPLLALACGVACAALSLPTAFDVDLVPKALRERFDFRWSAANFRSEFRQWRLMQNELARWSELGRALALHTRPGESLLVGTIGAIGYYSGLELLDPYGLINREEFEPQSADARRSAGHQRTVALATLLARRPTYLHAEIVPTARPWFGLRPDPRGEGPAPRQGEDRLHTRLRAELGPGGAFEDVTKVEWIELVDDSGAPSGRSLRLVRYTPD